MNHSKSEIIQRKLQD